MGNGRRAWSEALEHAQKSFRGNQAIFTAQLRDSQRKLSKIRKDTRLLQPEADESYRRIEAILLRLLDVLPEVFGGR